MITLVFLKAMFICPVGESPQVSLWVSGTLFLVP